MYPSWTTASWTISPSTGAVASSWGMLAVFAGDRCGRDQQAVGRALDADDRPHQHGQERRDDQRRGEADHEGDLPVALGRHEKRHFPTATFRSARAACRILTPESLIRATPLSSAVWSRTTPTAPTAVSACLAIRFA